MVLQTLQRRYFKKKMSALDNLSKKGTSITLGEDELLPERMRSYPCLYDKICKQRKERKNKALKRKKETKRPWSIILFKHYMPSPNVNASRRRFILYV